MRVMKGRVLVVDDDAALAEMLGIVLRGEGFEPTFVADGDRALDAFRDTRPDLVLLDLMLPGADGIDVCRQIRGESGVPIVMLTAKSDTVDVVLGRRVHEWHLGVAVLGVLAGGRVTGWWNASSATVLLALAGAWLVAKDWRDVSPAGEEEIVPLPNNAPVC